MEAAYQPQAPQRDVRECILDEASRLFGERGYDSTSIDSIAFAVGIRKSSLLYHFKTKERLRDAVIRRLLERWKDVIPQLLTAAPNGRDRFESTLEAVVDFFMSDPLRARLCVREALERPDELRDLIREHLGPYLRLVADYIRWGQRDGSADPDVDPEAWLVHVLHMTVTMAAFAGITEALSGESPDACQARQRTELIRLARAALLKPF